MTASEERWGSGGLALTAVAIAVLAPLPCVGQSLASLAADDSEMALNYVDRPSWVQGFLYVHMAGGGVALLLSPVQLSARLRARVPRAHRMSGRIVLCGIAVGGVAGLVLAPFNLAGPVGVAGFGLLAVLWLGVLVPLVGDFRTAYGIVPFLAWVPNLLVVEWLLRRQADRTRTAPAR